MIIGAGRQRRSVRPGQIRDAVVASTVFIAVALSLSGCSALGGGPRFEVGDCVRVVTQIIDSELADASCDEAVGSFDAAERIYRVDSIIEHTDGGCPQLTGFFPVEFVHEPDGVTYCLVQES